MTEPLSEIRLQTLADRQTRYLEVRGHTLSIAGLPWWNALRAQSKYVLGEGAELHGAVYVLTEWTGDQNDTAECERAVRHEIADIVLAATTLAKLLGVEVEECIDEKTEADRGRG